MMYIQYMYGPRLALGCPGRQLMMYWRALYPFTGRTAVRLTLTYTWTPIHFPHRRLFTRPAASSAGGEVQGPPPRPPHALSDGVHLLLAALLGIYTEAYAYSPATLQPVFTTLTGHLVSELTAG